MDFLAIIFLVVVAIMITVAILSGKNPVMTDFEARQRGIPVSDRKPEEQERARRRSDKTTGTALQVFVVLGVVLAVCAIGIYYLAPELLIFTVPIFIGLGVLFLFVMMWYDEERIKANYGKIRIER